MRASLIPFEPAGGVLDSALILAAAAARQAASPTARVQARLRGAGASGDGAFAAPVAAAFARWMNE